MRPRVLLLVLALAGCFSDPGVPDEGTSTGTTEPGTTSMPTTGEFVGCGDMVLQPAEDCDNGAANGQYAACSAECVVNICGDGVRGPPELCDDGDDDETDDCTTKCGPPRCGDGFVHADEMCDDGNDDESDGCTTKCGPPSCGDGVVSAGEQCDLGVKLNADDGDCTTLCTTKKCGDGFVQRGEACDPGADPPVLPCNPMCEYETCGDKMLAEPEVCERVDMMDTSCTEICTLPVCGDGFVGAMEACDDGNNLNGDDCTEDCTESICGDGKLAKDEDCEDGNSADGDDCSANCVRNARYVFVSSLRYAGGAIGSPAKADAECQKLAEAAVLPGKYRAWLSNGALSPAMRFDKSLDRAYVLPRTMATPAKQVANDWLDLVDGTLEHAIDVDEHGAVLTTGTSCETETQLAWTGTSRSAGPYDSVNHCEQWTTSVGTAHGVAGLIGGTGTGWTEGCPMATCDLKAHLYCFEQP